MFPWPNNSAILSRILRGGKCCADIAKNILVYANHADEHGLFCVHSLPRFGFGQRSTLIANQSEEATPIWIIGN